MKLIKSLLFTFFTAALIMASLCQIKAQNHVLAVKNTTINDFGKKLTLSKGQILILTLKNHVDDGYHFNLPEYDSRILHLFKYSAKSPTPNSRLGYPGEDILKFLVLKTGKTTLKVTSTRPWGKKDSILTYSACLIIK